MTAYAGLRALIIDDSANMRVLLRALLQTLGINNVREAENGDAGFDLLCQHPADLVLTDLAMKPTDGLQFTLRLRRGPASPNRKTPIIMVTGFADVSSVVAARDAGVNEILAKPVTMQDLALRIGAVIDRPRDFVRSENYVGPDRRRRNDTGYAGPKRRFGDQKALL